MVMFSRSTKPRPRHQPRVEALEERLALNAGAATRPSALQSPAVIREADSGTSTPAAAVALPFIGRTEYTLLGPVPGNPGTLIFVGTGTSSLVGRSTSTAYVTPHNPVSYDAYVESTVTNGAFKGDKIIFSGTVYFTEFPYKAEGDVSIIGGTGHFAHATGLVHVVDQFALDPGRTYIQSDHQTFHGDIYL